MQLRKLRFHAEYAAARLGLLILPRLSRMTILRLARVAGAVAYVASRHLRQIGLANLEVAYRGELTPGDKARILRGSFRSFALVLLDTFWFARDTERRIREFVRFDPSHFERLFRPGPQICVSAHMGNWEVLGMAVSLQGYPLVSVAAPLENEPLDRLFNELRNRTGQKILSKHGAVKALLRTLKEGGKIALLLDQNTKPSRGGIFVDFFGVPAPISSAAATLALRTDALVCLGLCLPQPDGTYLNPPLVYVEKPTDLTDRHAAEAALTASIARAMEQGIREHPENWLWMYKRWKYIAPGAPREAYPAYSKPAPGG